MSNKRNLFNVVVFDLLDVGKFDSFGRLEKLGGSVEKSTLSGEDALNVIEMFNEDNLDHIVNLTDHESVDEVVGFRVKINFGFISRDTARLRRDQAMESIAQWAEKSRVEGSRGFRNYALMNGRLEENANMDYVYTTKVLLSTMVHYSDKTATAGVEYDDERIFNETDHLIRGLYNTFGSYRDFELTIKKI